MLSPMYMYQTEEEEEEEEGKEENDEEEEEKKMTMMPCWFKFIKSVSLLGR